jgi:hypothetical protein
MDERFSRLFSSLEGNANVQNLELRFLTDDPGAILLFTRVLATMPNVNRVCIYLPYLLYPSIGELMWRRVLIRDVGSLETLTSFALNSFNAKLYNWLPCLAPCMRRMREISLRSRSLEDLDSASKVQVAFRNSTALEKITLEGVLPKARTDCDGFAVFLNVLSTLPNLRTLDLSSVIWDVRWGKRHQCEILELVRVNQNLAVVLLPTIGPSARTIAAVQAITTVQAKAQDEIYYICKLRQMQENNLLTDAPLSLWPLIIAKLGKGKWFNVVHHLLVEKPEVLLGASRLSAKRKREDEVSTS